MKHTAFSGKPYQFRQGLYYLPSNIQPTDNLAAILFFHGAGEWGSTPADLTKLLTQGLPYVIENMPADLSFTSPKDGKVWKFLVVSVQADNDVNPSPFSDEAVNALLYVESLIGRQADRNHIYATGLSWGGTRALMGVAIDRSDNISLTGNPGIGKITSLIAASVPMSAAYWNLNGGATKGIYPTASNIKFWLFCGDQDAFYPYSVSANADLNANNNGSSKLTTMVGVAHGNWINMYSPNFKESGMNIYEWMLANSKDAATGSTTTFPVSSTSSTTTLPVTTTSTSTTRPVITSSTTTKLPITSTTTTTTQKKLIVTLQIYDDGSIVKI